MFEINSFLKEESDKVTKKSAEENRKKAKEARELRSSIDQTLNDLRAIIQKAAIKLNLEFTLKNFAKLSEDKRSFKIDTYIHRHNSNADAAIKKLKLSSLNPFDDECSICDIMSFYYASCGLIDSIKEDFIMHKIDFEKYKSQKTVYDYFGGYGTRMRDFYKNVLILRGSFQSKTSLYLIITDVIKQFENDNDIEIFWTRDELSPLEYDGDGGIRKYAELSSIYLKIFPANGKKSTRNNFYSWYPGSTFDSCNGGCWGC